MSPESVRGEVANPVKAVQTAICGKMYNSENPSDTSKTFICYHDLRDLWREHDLISLFPPELNDGERKKIKDQYLQVLSILIFIGWSSDDILARFRSEFLRAILLRDDANLPFNLHADANLPFNEAQLAFLGSSANMFRQQQFAFIPAIIEESGDGYIQMIDGNRRLPFSEQPVHIGDGAYGNVTQVVIAARCFRNLSDPRRKTESIEVSYLKNGMTTSLLMLISSIAHGRGLQDIQK